MSLTLASDEVKVLLDSLPYVDTEYDDPAMQSQVRALIEAEMGSMQPRDYLAHLPKPSEMDFPDNPVLASEVPRCRRTTSTSSALSSTQIVFWTSCLSFISGAQNGRWATDAASRRQQVSASSEIHRTSSLKHMKIFLISECVLCCLGA